MQNQYSGTGHLSLREHPQRASRSPALKKMPGFALPYP
jgi:hypothetical protein